MSHSEEAQKSGLRHVHYFEVDMDECQQEYGTAPCSPREAYKYFIDDFTDTNGTPLQNHTTDGYTWIKASGTDLLIKSNKLAIDTVSTVGKYFNTNDFSAPITTIEFTMNVPAAMSGSFGVYVRATGTTGDAAIDDFYDISFSFTAGVISLTRQLNGVPNQLDNSFFPAIVFGSAAQYKIELVGNTINVYVDDVLKVSGSDSLINGDNFGIRYTLTAPYVATVTVDDMTLYAGVVDDTVLSTACYKTRATCQFPSAYSAATKTYRFFESSQDALDLGLSGFPLLKSAKTAPARITPGKGLGISAELSVSLMDARHHDRGVDPYVAHRTYDPSSQGTFWGKWLARNKYYTNRTVRYYDGFLTADGYDANNFRSREYIITKIDCDKNGVARFKCDDILQKLNTAVCPTSSEVILSVGVTDTDTEIPWDVTGALEFPFYLADGSVSNIEPFAGSLPFYLADGNASFIEIVDDALPFYLTTGAASNIALIATAFPIGSTLTVRIGSELMRGTVAETQLESVTRGYRGSVAAAHDAGEVIQDCIDFINVLPTTALRTVMAYAGITEANIDTAGWDAQAESWLGLNLLDGVISSPEKVKDVVKRLCVQGTVYVWWDEFNSLVKLLAVAPQGALDTLTTYGDAYNFVKRTTATQQNMREQITSMLIWYNKINAAENDEPTNYAEVFPAFDAGAESGDQWDLARVEQIECDFVSATGHASAIGNRTLGRLRDGEQILKFQTTVKEPLTLGDEFIAQTDAQQAADGSQDSVRMQVIEMYELPGGKVSYEAMKSAFQATRYAYIAPNTVGDYTTASETERERYAFICKDSGFFDDGTEGYKII